MTQLAYGYNAGVPDDAPAAWGARWIVTQEGYIDQVPDRTDLFGDDEAKQRLLSHLNDEVRTKPRTRLMEMLQNGEVHTRQEKEVVLFEDDVVRAVGNTNASAGYFYIAIYLIPAPVWNDYSITFVVDVDAQSQEDAVDEARRLIAEPSFEPISVEKS